MATIGLRDVHYALLIEDPVTGTPSYETPVKVIGAITANINPNSSTATLFYDDGPGDTAATMGEITLELNLADIPLDIQAVWLGHEYVGGILKRKGGDTPPWLAIGFRSLKSNGAYRYMWLNKGKFSIPEEDYATKGDSVEFATPTITGSFVKRDNDDEWERTTDEDAPGFNPSYVATWFLSPLTIIGAYATGQYGSAKLTVSGVSALADATVTIGADEAVVPGEETAAWTADDLVVTLAHGAVYSKAALQAIINAATGTAPGALTLAMDRDLLAAEATSLTLTLAVS
jgi:phi13 family phage major tail protein